MAVGAVSLAAASGRPYRGGLMTPPRTLLHVEWNAALREDRPHHRRERARTFRFEAVAARQVIAVRKWEATHTELIGVWRAVGFDDRGVVWERLDAAAIDDLVAVVAASDDLQDPTNQEEDQ